MEEFIEDDGKKTRWKDMEYLLGMMEGNIQEIMSTTKNKDKVLLNGQTEGNILACGTMENSMVLEFTLLKIKRKKKVSGIKEKE
jgi:hypothetical protein